MNGDSRPPAPGSPLGFGCAGLLRLPSAADQNALLQTAYDAGIRHFDAARMYGLGKAENVLGAFVAPIRAEVTVTTKFGLQISEGLARVSNVQTVARWVLGRFPGLRKAVRRRLKDDSTRDYSVAVAKASFEESLRALGTEYVDFLMLHEPKTLQGIEPGLADLLDGWRSEGRVRAFGTAGEFGLVEAMAREHPRLTQIVQVQTPNLAERRGAILNSPARRLFTFGHLQADLERVIAKLKRENGAVRAFDLEPGDRDAAGLLILRRATLLNPEGCTLFFTASPARLKRTAEYVLRPAGAGELDALDALLEPEA